VASLCMKIENTKITRNKTRYEEKHRL